MATAETLPRVTSKSKPRRERASWFDMGVRYPLLDANSESNIRGLFLAGDVSGTPDIKAAVNRGYDVAQHIIRTGVDCRPPCDAHVVIVGGGPAGISAAIELTKAGISNLVLEKGKIFSTIRHLGRHKELYLASTSEPRVRAALPFFDTEVGPLLEQWERILSDYPLNIHEGETVEDIRKTDKFLVVTNCCRYVCDRVILAIGKVTYLEKLGVGEERLPKVLYELDGERYREKRVVVVGGTEQAYQAAEELAENNRVTLVVPPGETLPPPPPSGVPVGLLQGRVKAVAADSVTVETAAGGERVIPNDLVFPFLGVRDTALPIEFFKKVGIEYERDWHWRRYALFALSCLLVGALYVTKKVAPNAVMVKMMGLDRLYPLVYSAVVTIFGLRAILRWRRARWRAEVGAGGGQTLRLASLIFFQVFFFWIVPEFLLKDWHAYALFYPWPLVFGPSTAQAFRQTPFWLYWTLGITLVAIPVSVYFHGKKFCTWVCGCGGLAETLGDSWRHFSPKGVGNTRRERQIYFVTSFSLVATVLAFTGHDIGVGPITVVKAYMWVADLFLIAIIPVAMYFFLGGKIWCRYWCPVVGWMNVVGKKTSRFKISAWKKRCIACGMCNRYCEVGVDVMRFALKGETFGMNNSSCIGCGICIQVCPTDVLRFGQLSKSPGPVLRVLN